MPRIKSTTQKSGETIPSPESPYPEGLAGRGQPMYGCNDTEPADNVRRGNHTLSSIPPYAHRLGKYNTAAHVCRRPFRRRWKTAHGGRGKQRVATTDSNSQHNSPGHRKKRACKPPVQVPRRRLGTHTRPVTSRRRDSPSYPCPAARALRNPLKHTAGVQLSPGKIKTRFPANKYLHAGPHQPRLTGLLILTGKIS